MAVVYLDNGFERRNVTNNVLPKHLFADRARHTVSCTHQPGFQVTGAGNHGYGGLMLNQALKACLGKEARTRRARFVEQELIEFAAYYGVAGKRVNTLYDCRAVLES